MVIYLPIIANENLQRYSLRQSRLL